MRGRSSCGAGALPAAFDFQWAVQAPCLLLKPAQPLSFRRRRERQTRNLPFGLVATHPFEELDEAVESGLECRDRLRLRSGQAFDCACGFNKGESACFAQDDNVDDGQSRSPPFLSKDRRDKDGARGFYHELVMTQW